MIAAHGLHWLDRQPQGPRWPSYGLAAAVTAALFVVALVSMRSVAPWRETERETSPAPVVVPLATCAPEESHRKFSRSRDRPPARRPIERAPQIPVAAPDLGAADGRHAARASDRGAGRAADRRRHVAPDRGTSRPQSRRCRSSVRTITDLPDTAMAIRGGAAYAPAGVTIGSRTKNSAEASRLDHHGKAGSRPTARSHDADERSGSSARSRSHAVKPQCSASARRAPAIGVTSAFRWATVSVASAPSTAARPE